MLNAYKIHAQWQNMVSNKTRKDADGGTGSLSTKSYTKRERESTRYP